MQLTKICHPALSACQKEPVKVLGALITGSCVGEGTSRQCVSEVCVCVCLRCLFTTRLHVCDVLCDKTQHLQEHGLCIDDKQTEQTKRKGELLKLKA